MSITHGAGSWSIGQDWLSQSLYTAWYSRSPTWYSTYYPQILLQEKMQSGMCKNRAVVLYSTEKCPVLVLKVSSKQKYHKGARRQEGTQTCKQCFLLNLHSVPQPWGTGNTEETARDNLHVETARDNPHASPVKVSFNQVVRDMLELPGGGEGGQSKRQK